MTEDSLTERAKKLNEERLEALLQLNDMTSADESELTHFALEAAVNLTGSTIGYIAFMNEDETVLTMYAWSRRAMQECALVDRPLTYPVATTGLWGEAVRQRKAVITNDLAAPDPRKKGMPSGHVHIIRHMNAPTFDGGRIVLVAGVGNKPTDYGDDDVRQLSLLMSGLWSIIQRRRAERALQDRNRFIESLLAAVPVAVFFKDREGRYLGCNAAFSEIMGVSSEAMTGRTVFDLWPSEHAAVYHARDLELMRQRQHQVYEYQVKDKDGRIRPVIYAKDVVCDANGLVTGLIGAFLDITERKLAEDALRESEGRFRSIIEQAPIAMAVVGLDERIEYINKKAITVFGYLPEDIPTMERWWMLAYPDETYRNQVIADWTGRIRSALAEGGEIKGNEYHVTCKDGSEKIVFISGVPVQQKIFVMFDDITMRKKAEESLRKSEERYRTLVETTNTGYVAIDEHGVVLDANEEYVRLSGHETIEEILGRSVIEWTVESDREHNAAAVNSCFRTGYIRNFEVQYADQTGRVTPVEINATRLSVGGKTQIITLCRDITERKRTEAALANAQKLESLGILAGGIAHDFNNLMTGIFGHIELASFSGEEGTIRRHLAELMPTMERARALTQQLLTFAKGGAPVQKVAPLFPFVRKAVQFALSGSNVSCRFQVADDLWSANYDKHQIEQVIDNLVINAQQAMPLGGTIECSARNVALADQEHPILQKGDYVRLSVTDSGIGIAPEILKRVFDPFFTTKSKGHGLGLATSYSIVNRHGGTIEVHSELGRGSTFHVYLPAAKEAGASPSVGQPRMHRGTGTFLVMDDEDVVCQAISAMLQFFGYTVVCTRNGQDAVDHVASTLCGNRPLCGMVFDLTVPGAMGGKEAIETIRRMGVLVPAFVASGYADDPVVKHPARYGFTASICKPFALSELMDLLNAHMKG